MKIFGNIHSTIYVLYVSSLIEKKNSCDLVQLSYQIGLLFSLENFFSIRIQREVTYILILVQLPSGEIEKLLPAKYIYASKNIKCAQAIFRIVLVPFNFFNFALQKYSTNKIQMIQNLKKTVTKRGNPREAY